MNKFFPLVLIVATSLYGHAQTTSGNRMLGGSLRFSSFSNRANNENVTRSFTISPAFGYFIKDNFAIGSGITVEGSRTAFAAGTSTSNTFGVGPFARYYKYSSNERFAFFGQAAFHFTFRSHHPASGDVEKSRATTVMLSPGAAYFLTEHWAVELLIAGLLFRSGIPSISNNNSRYSNIYFDFSSLSPMVGFHYHF